MTNKERFLSGELFRYGDEIDEYFKLVIIENSSAKEHYLFRQSSPETWKYEHPLIPYDEKYAFEFVSEITEVQDLVCISEIFGIQEMFTEELEFAEMYFDDDDSKNLE